MNVEITEAVRGGKRARRNLANWPSFSFLEPIGELSKRCIEGGGHVVSMISSVLGSSGLLGFLAVFLSGSAGRLCSGLQIRPGRDFGDLPWRRLG